MQFDSWGVLYALDGKEAQLNRITGESVEVALKNVLQHEGEETRHNLTAFTLVDDNTLAIVNARDGNISVLKLGGKHKSNFGEKGKKAGMLKSPSDLAFSINHRVYIADKAGGEIAVYSPSGVYLYGLGSSSG